MKSAALQSGLQHADCVRVYSTCHWDSSSRWITANTGHWSDLDNSPWWLYNLSTRYDECLFCLNYSLCFDGQIDAYHLPPWGTVRLHSHRVCECYLLYPVHVTWSRDSEQSCHLSVFDGIRVPLAGSTSGVSVGLETAILCSWLIISAIRILCFHIIKHSDLYYNRVSFSVHSGWPSSNFWLMECRRCLLLQTAKECPVTCL